MGQGHWSTRFDRSVNNGTTEPEEPKTLPKRTIEKRVLGAAEQRPDHQPATRLEALTGRSYSLIG